MEQPVARKEIVTDTYFGTTIEDPYRWMEDWKGEELKSWVAAQGAYTRAYLDALPERQALSQRELPNWAMPLLHSIISLLRVSVSFIYDAIQAKNWAS